MVHANTAPNFQKGKQINKELVVRINLALNRNLKVITRYRGSELSLLMIAHRPTAIMTL
jgi:hypothetical protein